MQESTERAGRFIPNAWDEEILRSVARGSLLGRFERKRREVRRTHPTAEEIAQHARAIELWAELQGNPFFSQDYDGAVEIREPHDHVEYEWAETEAEWRDRAGHSGATVTFRSVPPPADRSR